LGDYGGAVAGNIGADLHKSGSALSLLRPRIESLVQADLGQDYSIGECSPMADGHGGLTWGFDVLGPEGQVQSFVLKMSPVGVPHRGSTDVFRQAKLLRTLNTSGLPVPAIRWASPGDDQLGAPFIAMERLPGRTFVIWEPDKSFLDGSWDLPSLWKQTASALGALHRFPWQIELRDWEQPASLADELGRWRHLLRHMEDDNWRRLAGHLYEALADSPPTNPRIGLIHGDISPGNVLFHEQRLIALIDWDLSAVAPLGIDLGWLLMMADVDAWAEGWKPVGPADQSALLDAYYAGGGAVTQDLGWYRAFAHFRMASITGLNLKLHRSGRRPDAIWERFAPSVARLLEQGPAFI
jgi:aminoglycoside phosphotransferase (APT) family kinase protein